MKIVAISDTHGKHNSLNLPDGDLLIHSGDISRKGLQPEVEDFLKWFSQQMHPHKIFIAGNHDFFFEKNSPDIIKSILPENIIYLNDSETIINGLKIWGSPITPWFYDWAFNRHRGSEINHHWKMIPDDTNILITHGPAYGIFDETIHHEHVGCKDLLRRVGEINPAVHICGHIHEGYGRESIGDTEFVNASVLNEQYELKNNPVVIEI